MNISKTVRDRAILSIFEPQGSTRVSCAKGNNFNFWHFWWSSWILAENKTLQISRKKVRDRAISSEFFIRSEVPDYPVPRGKISVFATFGGRLGF